MRVFGYIFAAAVAAQTPPFLGAPADGPPRTPRQARGRPRRALSLDLLAQEPQVAQDAAPGVAPGPEAGPAAPADPSDDAPEAGPAEPPARPLPVGFHDAVRKIRLSVVRITSDTPSPHLFAPWMRQTDSDSSQAIGSGWVVGLDPVLIVTNAHVVSDATTVSIQLPALGREDYTARVRLISSDFDLAFLTTDEEDRMLGAVEEAGQRLEKLELGERGCEMGAEVFALGFSLGSSNAKLSQGIISGSSRVDGNVVCQSTAPISPGNSGGPLLFSDDHHVVGVNFASAAAEGSQNNNYVVPAFRVRQLLAKLDLRDPKASGYPIVAMAKAVDGRVFRNMTENPHIQVRIPQAELLATPGSPAIYGVSKGCSKGIFVSKVSPTSVFTAAEPPLPAQFFLEDIDGAALDSQGDGLMPRYSDDPVSYSEMLTLRDDIGGNATVRICAEGQTSQHTVLLQWRPSFQAPVRFVDEPNYAALDYELFGGVAVMEMTLNHIASLVEEGFASLARFMLPQFQTEGHLFISAVLPGSDAREVLREGMVLASVNGRPVATLAQYREAFVPGGGAGEPGPFQIETDMGVVFAMDFQTGLKEQLQAAQEGATFMLTPAVRAAAQVATGQDLESWGQAAPQAPTQGIAAAPESPAAPQQSAEGAPAAPQQSAQGAPAAPQQPAQGAPAAPQAAAQGAPAAPQQPAEGAPAAPQQTGEGAPAAPQQTGEATPAQPVADSPSTSSKL
mmetsp:Transcript_26152/g.59121  ORF Transcript_26152/g.59121 Transcript_26152/m.59121 type:complete len:731 (-) Transcript_26152:71-2263(-)